MSNREESVTFNSSKRSQSHAKAIMKSKHGIMRKEESRKEKSSLCSDTSALTTKNSKFGVTGKPQDLQKGSLKPSKSNRYTKARSTRPTYDLVSPSRLKNYNFKPKNKSTMLSSLKERVTFKHSSQSQHLQNKKRDSSKISTPLKPSLKPSKRSTMTNKKKGTKKQRFMAVTNPLKYQQYKKEKISNLGTKNKTRAKKKTGPMSNSSSKVYSKSNFLKDNKSTKNGYFSSKISPNQEQSKSIQLSSAKQALSLKKSQFSSKTTNKGRHMGKDPRDSIYEKILHGDDNTSEIELTDKSKSRSRQGSKRGGPEKPSLSSYVKESLSNFKAKKGNYLSPHEHKSVDLVKGQARDLEFRTHGSHMMK